MARPRKDQNVTSGAKPKEFKFSSDLGKLSVPEDMVGRWVRPDDANLHRKLEEGWEFVNKTNCPNAKRLEELGLGDQVKDGGQMGGVIRYREMVGMCLPKEMKESRDRQIAEKTMNQTKAKIFMREAKRDLGDYSSKLEPTISID